MKSIVSQYFHPVSDSTETLSSRISTASPQNISTHLTKLVSDLLVCQAHSGLCTPIILITWDIFFPLDIFLSAIVRYSTLFTMFFVPHYNDRQSLCFGKYHHSCMQTELLMLLRNSALNLPIYLWLRKSSWNMNENVVIIHHKFNLLFSMIQLARFLKLFLAANYL